VTGDELRTGVEIALGALPLAECSPFTRDYDGVDTVDELVATVVNAQGICPNP
jgi:hypothetical protein